MGRRYSRQWVVGAITGVICLCGLTRTGHAFHGVEVGGSVPAFSLTGIDGEKVAVSGGGQVMVLAFVRQGQEKSTEALGALQELSAGHTGQVAVVAVVANPGEGDAAAWARGAGAAFPVLLDTDGAAYGLYGVRVMPSTGVVKADGTLTGIVDGFTRRTGDEIEHLIQVALGFASADEPVAGADPVSAKSDARKSAERSLEKAKLLLKRKMGDKAVGSAEEAVAADDEYGDAHVFLGEILLDLGDDNAAKALPHFEKALALDPKSMAAKIGLARVRSVQGDTQGAVVLLQQAAMLNPRPEKVYYELGRVYERAEDYQHAVEAYRQALDRLLH
ncbi:MAG: tetratricopeptide repeat protein [Deferrisomatales bacterium]|nr:tetratricopeptide repeat protein [Deferrisomatales bacterium]